tara:strand:+ start:6404 stop:8737 length:2334 start_codon:yes stop_codon:yes gene_type:complete
MDIKTAVLKFEKIANKTGIMNEEIIMEPNHDDREMLWDITRVFADHIYKLDIDKNADQNEVNQLCHYSIVALHWNDILMSDERFSFENGRFRRDTIALALCFFTRIQRDYSEYDKLKDGWIMPHTNFSFLMWTIRSIIDCNNDNIFKIFDPQIAKEANDLLHELGSLSGHINLSKAPDNHPLIKVWWEIHSTFSSARIPYQFTLNYIWNSESMPGGMGLLPNDREMNKAYLKEQIKNKQFPSNWVLMNDLAFVYMFFAATTDEKLDTKETKEIKTKIGEWINDEDKEKKKSEIERIYNESKSQFDSDPSKERFSFSLENIRRRFLIKYEGDKSKINDQLAFVLEDLLAVAWSDKVLINKEYELIEQIRLRWGLDLKLFDDELIDKFTAAPLKVAKEPKEEGVSISEEYLPDYPGDLYCENEHWWRAERPLFIKSFPNVFSGNNDYSYDNLFRRFTKDEVNMIVNKIKSTEKLIYLNFVREIMSERFDLRGMKTPFWFIPFAIYGNDHAGILYFEQNGIYNNFNNPSELSMVIHCDLWNDISVKPGYNGLTDEWGYDVNDEDVLSSLKVDYIHQGNSGSINVVETHGNDYASTLPIVKAIWDNAWRRVVEISKDTGTFILGPPPHIEAFNSWQELLNWAESDEITPKGASKSERKIINTSEDQTEEKLTLQGQLAERFTSIYSDAVVKKIDDGNYLDIHLPNIHNRKGTHIWFNTPKSGGIKIGFYCRDKEFVKMVVDASSDTIETYSSGLRPKGAPVFDNIDTAIDAVQSFIKDLKK